MIFEVRNFLHLVNFGSQSAQNTLFISIARLTT